MADEKRSGWFYVLVSCGVLFIVGAILVGAGTFMAVRWGNNLQEELEDPVARTANAKEMLGAEQLPEGYHATVHIRFPLGLGRMIVLTDGEATTPDSLAAADHFFFYMEGPGWDADWKKFAAGGEPPFDNLEELNINIDTRQRLTTGDLVVGKMEVFYAANRGEISGEGFHSNDGVFAVVLVRCPEGDKHSRTIVWSGPAPSEDHEDGVSGTTGDPVRIGEMLGHFSLCG